jgi:DnaK suppressor protein
LDQIQQSTERELTIGNLERESKQLREVQAALDRIRLGDFGVCPRCGEEIGMKRLAAVPWALSCIACQTAEDHTYQHPRSAFDGEPLISQGVGF